MKDLRGLWRGICLGDGKWVKGLLADRNFDRSTALLYDDKYAEEHWVDSSTLGECTGLRDKNRKLIFEGDIVKHPNGDCFESAYITKYARFAPRKPGTVFAVFPLEDTVIVGNIHDNPELLN